MPTPHPPWGRRGDLIGQRPSGPLSRECPTCGAKPNQSCIRRTSRFGSNDYGYTTRLKHPHQARKSNPEEGRE